MKIWKEVKKIEKEKKEDVRNNHTSTFNYHVIAFLTEPNHNSK